MKRGSYRFIFFAMLMAFTFIVLASNTSAWSDSFNTNLVAYYKMDGNNSGTAINLSNSVNQTRNITTTGSPVFVSNGIIGNATKYSGSGQYGTFNNYRFPTGLGNKSVSVWVNITANTNSQFVFCGGNSGGTRTGFGLGFSNTGTDRKFWVFRQGADVVAPSASTLDVWHHVVVVSANNFTYLYVDGVNVVNGSAAYNTADDIAYIGQTCWGAGRLQGTIDEMAVWDDRVITASEVVTLYNSGAGDTYTPSTPATPLNITVTRIVPTNSSYVYGGNMTFNSTLTPTAGNITNATLRLYYTNGTLLSVNTTTFNTNVTSYASWNYSLINASYIYDVYACASNATTFICNNQGNTTFNLNTTIVPWVYTLNNNIQSYWAFDESSGTSALNFINGSLNATGAVSWVSGIINNSINLSTQYMNTSYVFPSGTAAKAVSIWFYPTDGSTQGQYLFSAGNTASGQGFGLGYNYDASHLQTIFVWSQGTGYDILSTATASTNNWHHVVINDYGNGTRKLYLDGVAINTTTNSYSTSQTNPLTIGKAYFGAGHFSGRIDEFAIWNRSLTDAEVPYIYNGGRGVAWQNTTDTTTYNGNVTIELLSPYSNQRIRNLTYNFSALLTPTYANITGTTLYVWYSNGTLYYNNSLTYNTNISITPSWMVNFTEQNSYKYNILGNASNSSTQLSNYAVSNLTFSINLSEASNCMALNITGGTSDLTNFPVYVKLYANQSYLINNTDYGNVRFYNSTCGLGTPMPYELDYYNSTEAGFWIKTNLNTGTNQYSLYLEDINTAGNETPEIVWSDYRYVYHFSEGVGAYTNDSISVANQMFNLNNSNVWTTQPFNWVQGTFGKGIRFYGDTCGISASNITSDLQGNNDMSQMIWGQVIGDGTDNHGLMLSLGYPSTNNYMNMRYENPAGTGTWRLDWNGGQWNTGTAPNLANQFHYLQVVSSVATWYIDTASLGTNSHAFNRLGYPVQVAGAYGIAAPWTGCVAMYNGTVDELRIANITFSTAYVDRTYQNANLSMFVFGEPSYFNTGIEINSVSPSNDQISTTNNNTFVINVTATGITEIENATLYIYNGTSGNLYYSNTTSISGQYAITNWTVNLPEGYWIWNADTFGNDSETDATSNRYLYVVTNNSAGNSGIVILRNNALNRTINFLVPFNYTTSAYLNLSANQTCYQEFANQSSYCGGEGTGLYSTTNYNLTDGNFNTGSQSSVATYINYTKPSAALGAIWNVKDYSGSANLTIPSACFTQNVLTLKEFYWTGSPATKDYVNWTCYNGTSWTDLRTSGDLPDVGVFNKTYEESISWIFNGGSNLNVSIGNRQAYFIPNNFTTINNKTNNFATVLNAYLATCTFSGGYCSVPITFSSDADPIFNYTSFFTSNEGFVENSMSYVNSTIETKGENFSLNVSYDTAGYSLTADLVYNNTYYPATVSTSGYNSTINRTLYVPAGTGNKTFYWRLGFTNSTGTFYANSTSANITVAALNMSLCGSPFTVPFLNYTFHNETVGNEAVTATFTGTFTYWLDNALTNKTYSFTNSTVNPNYAFCFTPADKTIYVAASGAYENPYSQGREFVNSSMTLTNSTTTIDLLLLPDSEGIYITFITQSITSGARISGALVEVRRTSDNALIEQQYTDGTGIAAFWLDSSTSYTITATASGYETYSTGINPVSSPVILYMTPTSNPSNIPSSSNGIRVRINPSGVNLTNATTYTFSFNISASEDNLVSYGFALWNKTTQLTGTFSGTSNDGEYLSTTLDTGNQTYIIMKYYYYIDDDDDPINRTYTWFVSNGDGTEYSLLHAFGTLDTYTNNASDGLFGVKRGNAQGDFSFALILFVIILFSAGAMTYKYGITSTTAVVFLIFSIILFIDVGAGLMPNPIGAVPHFVTIFAGAVLVGMFIKEMMY